MKKNIPKIYFYGSMILDVVVFLSGVLFLVGFYFVDLPVVIYELVRKLSSIGFILFDTLFVFGLVLAFLIQDNRRLIWYGVILNLVFMGMAFFLSILSFTGKY